MKKTILTIAINSSLLVIASLPISMQVLAADDKNQTSLSAIPTVTTDELNKQKVVAEQNQKVINEAKE